MHRFRIRYKTVPDKRLSKGKVEMEIPASRNVTA
jgi:hypothetical protein